LTSPPLPIARNSHHISFSLPFCFFFLAMDEDSSFSCLILSFYSCCVFSPFGSQKRLSITDLDPKPCFNKCAFSFSVTLSFDLRFPFQPFFPWWSTSQFGCGSPSLSFVVVLPRHVFPFVLCHALGSYGPFFSLDPRPLLFHESGP